jgi:hypothetical protein
MKYFFAGTILAAITAVISALIWNIEQAYLIPGGLAVFFIGLSMIFSGALVSGDTMRANFAAETTEDRAKRNSAALRLAMLGLPNFIVAAILYFF